VGVGVDPPLAGNTASFGGGSRFTSLGTITPRFVGRTGGNPASDAVGTLAAVCGGGSLATFGPQAHSQTVLASKISGRPIDFVAMPPT